VAHGLEAFFGKVSWDVEDVEELEGLREGISTGEI
jgi:hypothetical protein